MKHFFQELLCNKRLFFAILLLSFTLQNVAFAQAEVVLRNLAWDRQVHLGGSSQLSVRGTTESQTSTFEFRNLGDGVFALKASANGLYVVAEMRSDENHKSLVARSESIENWERFRVIQLSDTTIMLQALNYGLLVYADSVSGTLKVSDTDDPAMTNEYFVFSRNWPIGLGTGTLGYSYWMQEEVAGEDGSYREDLYDILLNDGIPTKSMKYYLNGGIQVSKANDMLSKGVSPVLIDHGKLKGWYESEYRDESGSLPYDLWDDRLAWNEGIAAVAQAWLNEKGVSQAKEIGKIDGGLVFYGLEPEMISYVGDASSSEGYDAFVQQHIDTLRKYGGADTRIFRGWLLTTGDFDRDWNHLKGFLESHPEQLSKVDYLGITLHNANSPDSNLARQVIDLLKKIHEITPIPKIIPYSYLRWVPGEATDDGAAEFWQYFQDHRNELLGTNFSGWSLSATLTKRSDGSGLAKSTSTPEGGYTLPVELSQGGAEYVQWMKVEDALRSTYIEDIPLDPPLQIPDDEEPTRSQSIPEQTIAGSRLAGSTAVTYFSIEGDKLGVSDNGDFTSFARQNDLPQGLYVMVIRSATPGSQGGIIRKVVLW